MHASGDLALTVRQFSYLSLHYVNIQEDSITPKANRSKGKGPPPAQGPSSSLLLVQVLRGDGEHSSRWS